MTYTYAWQRYFAELIGTMILVLIGVGAVVISGSQIGIIGIGFAFGLTLMALIYILGPISGCHLNPAVTVGLALARRIEPKHVIPYILAQFVGAVAGAWIVCLIASGKIGFDAVSSGFASTGYGEHSPQHYSMIACLIVEIAITALLVFVVIGTTQPEFPIGFSPILIGATLIALHLIAIPVTNASINLARSFGTAIFVKGWALEQLWFFAGAHMIAAAIAVLLHQILANNRN